jgi:ribonuclease HI
MVSVLEDEDVAEVVSRERQLLDPALRASEDRVGELLHPDFLEYGASGRIWPRAGVIAALAGDPDVSGEGIDFSPVKLADDVVLLTYRIEGDAPSLRSSIWVKDPVRGWRLRFHQGTRSLAT